MTTEEAFESYVEEILLTRCGWKSAIFADKIDVSGSVAVPLAKQFTSATP